MDSGLSSEVRDVSNAFLFNIELCWGSNYGCELSDVTLPRKASSVKSYLPVPQTDTGSRGE